MSNKFLALVIEDMEDLAFLLQHELKKADIASITVPTLAEGLAQATATPHPSVIVLDLSLRDATPEQTIAVIPDLQRCAPVIVLSGFTHPETIKRVEQSGAMFHPKSTDGQSFIVKVVRAILNYCLDDDVQMRENVEWLKDFLQKHEPTARARP